MPTPSPLSVLVTGASSGIGEATVRTLTARGHDVHALARRADRLEALATETGCVSHEIDVRDRAAIEQLASTTTIDVLVNNAGLGRAMGAVWDAEADDIDRTIETNITAVLHLLRVFLPPMIDRGMGHVVNLSSVLALYPGPAALYGATKGAVHKLSRDLRQELQGTGVRVTEINPGRVTTEFYDVALDDAEAVARAKDTGIVELTPSDVSDAITYAIEAPRHVNISMIEIVPTEQTYGGAQFSPIGLSGAVTRTGEQS